MTNLTDLDRSLSAFLEDGPGTAPEAPVIAALAHARTSPRRVDPIRRLRPDVMAGPWRPLGLRPVLVLGLLGLLVAGIAVAVGASPIRQPSVVVPAPTSTTTPEATPISTPAPSNLIVVTPVPTFARDVTMLVSAGSPYPIHVTDTTGNLVGATSLQPGDGASVNGIEVRADSTNLRALIVTWVGTPCEAHGSVRVDEGQHEIAVLRDPCQGDALPLDRIVRLEFRDFVAAGDWAASIDNGSFPPTASGSPAP
jgi:hypothetical protein